MANIKSAKKRILTSTKAAARNKSVRSELKSTIRKAEVALAENADNSAELVHKAIVKLDTAAGKKILHSNNAGRKKSQLQKKLNQVG